MTDTSDTLLTHYQSTRKAQAREANRLIDEQDEGWRTAGERAREYTDNKARNAVKGGKEER